MLENLQEKYKNFKNKRDYEKSFKQAMGENRHTRRALAKINGIAKIPSNHLPITK